jgi:5-methylcytosine-specific restriction endonuclease McrA
MPIGNVDGLLFCPSHKLKGAWMMDEKKCRKCREVKPATSEYFARNKKTPDGYQLHCKACTLLYREENRERAAIRTRAWRADNPERVVESRKSYYIANRERLSYQASERARAWRDANKERLAEYRRTRRALNREAVRARDSKRRALKRNADGTYTGVDIEEQLNRQKGKCYYCSCKLGKSYHVDHIVPLSRGGSNRPENLVCACAACNLSKHNKLPHEWPQGGRLL